jgi:hypothetical protein
MSTVGITKRMAEGSPQSRTRLVLAYYSLSILTGMIFFFLHGRLAFAADLIAAVFYLAATALFYGLFAGTSSRANDRQRTPRDS